MSGMQSFSSLYLFIIFLFYFICFVIMSQLSIKIFVFTKNSENFLDQYSAAFIWLFKSLIYFLN